MSRIYPEATMYEVIYAITEGNPGAVRVAAEAISASPIIDPQNILGHIGPIIMLDTYRVYGEDIWVLYKDICDQHIGKMIGVLRAVQLGIIGGGQLDSVIYHTKRGSLYKMPIDDLMVKVREKLNQFDETRPLKPYTIQRHERETRRTIKQEEQS
jgi:hypothetical protein